LQDRPIDADFEEDFKEILKKLWNLSGAAWGWAGILPGSEIQKNPHYFHFHVRSGVVFAALRCLL